nr:polymorphic toxin type 50 domain-containing protein [Pseudomonas aeruginosa]
MALLGGRGSVGAGAKEVPQVKWSAQEKHFPGHNSYTPGRSVLTSDPRKLAESAGSGVQVGDIPVGLPGSKERVNFGGNIGTYIDRAGVATPTSNGIIHYSKDGIHIVPARP